jgi:murein DD-endopeptidase MepM/ murein hydrolase activator NlpD
VGLVIAFITLATALVELTRQQLPFGQAQVRAWMLGTPQPVASELQDNGYINAGIGVDWEGYTHPEDPSPPRGIPFTFEPELNCLFQDPHYPTHTGVDFPEALDTPITATMAGKVVWAAANGPWGNLVVVENSGHQTYYAHLRSFSVAKGEIVSRGTQIGKEGSTGNSTGPHLHYGIKVKMKQGAVWMDPLGFFDGASYKKVACTP